MQEYTNTAVKYNKYIMEHTGRYIVHGTLLYIYIYVNKLNIFINTYCTSEYT